MVAMLGGVSAVRDPGGGPVPIHDFDLHLDDGRVIAVEVTRCNVESELQQQAEIDRRDPSFPGLRFNWHLGMASSFDVARIRAEAPRLLAVLEARGIQSVGLRGARSESECPAAVSLRSLGVRLLYRLDEASSAGGRVDIGAGPVVGATAPHVVIGVAEEAAARRGKAAKLAAASGTCSYGWRARGTVPLPRSAPTSCRIERRSCLLASTWSGSPWLTSIPTSGSSMLARDGAAGGRRQRHRHRDAPPTMWAARARERSGGWTYPQVMISSPLQELRWTRPGGHRRSGLGACWARPYCCHLIAPGGEPGDVRLAVLVGLVLGMGEPGHCAASMFLSSWARRRRRATAPPRLRFGPSLAAGAVVAVLVGEQIIRWYAGLVG